MGLGILVERYHSVGTESYQWLFHIRATGLAPCPINASVILCVSNFGLVGKIYSSKEKLLAS